MLTLITGGVRSGKSRYALELARQAGISRPKCFLATAEPLDEEMKIRIARHQDERAGDFLTIEEPIYLARAIEKVQKESGLVLVDCLTLWVSNLFFHFADKPSQIKQETESLIHILQSNKTEIIFVTNEVGLGLIPDNPLGRRYVDELGGLNQKVAQLSDEVILMIAGIPKQIKGEIGARLGN